jgi:hypothetical protein
MDIQSLVKERLADIKKILFNEAEPAKFVEATLADGVTQVVIEPALEAGAVVSVIDAEGNKVTAPAGEHQLASGEVITVDETGAITEIEIEDEMKKDDKKVEEEMAAQFAEIANGINAKIAEATDKFNEQINAYKSELSEAKQAFENEKTKNAEFAKQVFDLLNKIADSESGSKEAASKQNFTKVAKEVTAKDEVSELVNNYLSRINK